MTAVQPGSLACAHAWALTTILNTAAPDPGASVLVSILSIVGGVILLIVLVFMLRSRPPAPPPTASSEDDRADVLARLQRHTQGFAPEGVVPPAEPVETQPRTTSAPAGIQSPAPGGDGDRLFGAEAEKQDAGPRLDIRLPSIMLLNLPPDADERHVETAPPLGGRAAVIERLREILPDLEPGPAGRTRYTGPDHDLTIDVGALDVVHTVVIDAAGATGVSMVGWLLDSTGWRAFVPKAGRFVDAGALEALAAGE